MLKGKRILLGISGGIAAYKIAFLIRLLKKSGAEVKCIMTPASSDFISPLVVSTLSENEVGIEFWNKSTGVWQNHVEYGLWADVFVLAPATANTISKLAHGSCDNLLLATYLSLKCPTIIAPAMDLDMYAHPTTTSNLAILKAQGVRIIPAESGFLASGLTGTGRMAEPETILAVIQNHFNEQKGQPLKGIKILITAGPTYEYIDPVRFIGNFSSGKMGYAIAEAALLLGAEVILVSGPTKLELAHENLKLIKIQTADEMLSKVKVEWESCNWGIFAAAVADYKPAIVASQKIKKKDENLSIDLVKNPDILKWAGSVKSQQQFLVGFALETQNVLENAKSKLLNKNLDAIVMNTLEDEGAGFSNDTNKISILDKHNELTNFSLKTKKEVADDILNFMRTFNNL